MKIAEQIQIWPKSGKSMGYKTCVGLDVKYPIILSDLINFHGSPLPGQIQIWLKSDKIMGYFTSRPTQVLLLPAT